MSLISLPGRTFGWRCRALALSILSVLLGAQAAQAQSCTVVATPPAFAPYTGTAGAGTGLVTVSCTVLGVVPRDLVYAVQMGFSAQASGTQRRMRQGGSHLLYSLSCDPAHAQSWGDGTGGTCVRSIAQTGVLGIHTGTFTVYGQLPAGQTPAAGTYTDSVPVMVLY